MPVHFPITESARNPKARADAISRVPAPTPSPPIIALKAKIHPKIPVISVPSTARFMVVFIQVVQKFLNWTKQTIAMNDMLKKPLEKLENLVNYSYSFEDIRNIDKLITNSMCSLSSGYGNHPAINDYIKAHKPQRIMEIGIANGDNAKKMIESAGGKVEYYGFDIFPGNSMDKIKEKLEETGSTVNLFKGYSNETIPANMDKLPQMDLIFIDGDHSYSGTKDDWENSKKLMKEDGVTFLHNYYSHKGVKKVVDEIRKDIYSVDIFDDFGWGLAKIERIESKL